MWNKNAEIYGVIWEWECVCDFLYVCHKLIWVHLCRIKINTLSRRIKYPPILASNHMKNYFQMYIFTSSTSSIYNHSTPLFFPPRNQQETNFSTFHCFSQPCLLALTTFPHLLNPPVFVEEILWTQYQAFFSPVVSWLCSLLWFLAKLLSALLWFPSSDNHTCPLLPPSPSVSFPSLNPQTCHAGFYTRLLSAVSLPVSGLNSPQYWRCEVNIGSGFMNQQFRRTERQESKSNCTQQ